MRGGGCYSQSPCSRIYAFVWRECFRKKVFNKFSMFSSVQLLSCVRIFVTPWTAARQESLSITNSRSPPKSMSMESVMPSNHLILCHLPSLLAFNLSQHQGLSQCVGSLHQVAKVIGTSASASVDPKGIQGWFPLRLIGLISLLSKGLSRVFSNTTIQNHQFFGAQLSLLSSSHICTWLLERP